MYRYLSYISDLANWAKSIAIAAVVTAMDFVSPIENFLVVILSLAFIVLGAGCGSRGFPEEQVHP